MRLTINLLLQDVFLVAQVRCGVSVEVWYGCVVNDSSSALGKEVSNA